MTYYPTDNVLVKWMNHHKLVAKAAGRVLGCSSHCIYSKRVGRIGLTQDNIKKMKEYDEKCLII